MSYGRMDTYPVFLLHSDRFSHRRLFAPAHPFGLHSLCWSLWKETLAQRSHPRCDVGLWKDSSCLGEQASVSSFLPKEFHNESSTTPDVVNQKFETFELKCNPLKFSWANQTFTKMSLFNSSRDFLSEVHPEPCGSLPSEMMPRTVNFITTQRQDALLRDWSSGNTL